MPKTEKNALVTGVGDSSGIGYATAHLLKQKGYNVCISGRHSKHLQTLANDLEVDSVLADMSKPKDIENLATRFDQGLDVLVNNAGIVKAVAISDISWEDCHEIFSVNVWGSLYLMKQLLPALEKRQGAITLVSSIAAETAAKPYVSLYAATKGALNALSKNLVAELTPKGIRINAVAPGPIDTAMFDKVSNPEEALAFKNALKQEIPMKRLGRPDEVADVIVAQLESTYVTGSIWTVDGGISVT